MFTGLVEEIGEIKAIGRAKGATRFTISGEKVLDQLKIDDSVSVNGTCLTVVSLNNYLFAVDAVEQTLKVTTLGAFSAGRKVNLERAIRADSRLGGHFVQGHIDGVGQVSEIQNQQGCLLISIRIPGELMKYIIPKGSIAIDGCSLTVASINSNIISIALIPHTLAVTTLGRIKVGDKVNIETDMLGKYAWHLLQPNLQENSLVSQFQIKLED